MQSGNDQLQQDLQILLDAGQFQENEEDLLNTLPLGSLSLKLINWILTLHTHRKNAVCTEILFRTQLELYIKEKTSIHLQWLKDTLPLLNESKVGLQNKLAGTYLMPDVIYKFMRDIYLLNDEPLIRLIRQYFHIPPLSLFKKITFLIVLLNMKEKKIK